MKSISSKEIKQLLLEMMDDIHHFCMENNIRYSLAFGTLIGSIRHKGFIPWDDDIDIYMLRDDYDRFRISYKPQKSYYKLNDPEQDQNYNRTFLKVEDTRTVVHEVSALDYLGIAIDIFPVDNLYNNLIQCKDLCRKVGMLRKMHMIKTLTSHNNLSFWKKGIIIVGGAFLHFCNTHRLTLKMIRLSKTGEKKSRYVSILDMDNNQHLIFERNIYKNVILREFEGRQYYAMVNFDIWLRQRYGDYMKLPPESERKNGSCHEFNGTYYK